MPKSAFKPCPICKKPATEKHIPFCSARCADIDLGKWLGERYRVETQDVPADDDETPPEGT